MIFDDALKICKVLLKLFPARVRPALIKMGNNLRLKRIERLKTPTSIVFFVTNKCNLKCNHCFYWGELNTKKEELVLEQIKKITNSLKDCYSILLTGGEPFLREDLVEVCEILDDRFRTLKIATNGFISERIFQVTSNILHRCNFYDVSVQLSIDGPRAIHDKIRGVANSFENTIKTLKALKGLEKKFHNFRVEVGITVSKENYKSVEKLVKYLLEFRVPISLLLTRGNDYGVYGLCKGISTKINPKKDIFIPKDELENLYKKISRLNDCSDYKFMTEHQKLLLEYSIKMIKNKEKILNCYAGKVDGVIYENGDVSFCELVKPIGNLKETDYDFYKLWNSKKANLMREKIKSCFCIHGCNLSTNIALDTNSMIKLMR